MGRIGKISVIPKDYSSAFPTMEKSLREKGYSRAPGTVQMKFPYRELSGKYRTGLDEAAPHILNIQDDNIRIAEQKRIKELRKSLERATGLDLGPTSDYYNYLSNKPGGAKVEPAKLIDGDNIYDLDNPKAAITYYWLAAHPTIASSLEAYHRGEFPAGTQYFVNDEEVEDKILYSKKKTANDAIIRFDSWSLDKRKKVARLLDLPVTEDTKEETVYNLVDNLLKGGPIASGMHQGADPIKVFTSYAILKDDVIYVKDLVEQALRNNIYKMKKGGRIFEGELEMFPSRDEMVDYLLDDTHQEDLLEIERKLKSKKLAKV